MKTEKKELLTAIKKASNNYTTLDSILSDLLSPKEYSEIIKRWQIILALHDGMDQRSISNKLKVSVSKITRGSRVLQNKGIGIAKVLK